MVVLKNKVNNSASSPITETPTLDHKFMVSMTLAPFAKNTTGSNPDISSAEYFFANTDEWRAVNMSDWILKFT